MINNVPLLDRTQLDKILSANPIKLPSSVPNIPFSAPSLSSSESPIVSDFASIENKILSKSRDRGPKTRGSIMRTLDEMTSDRYDNFVPGDYDNEDAYAQGQGWPSKMINGVGKGLLLAGTTFLQSTIGLANGIAKASSDGRAASFYDNEFNRTLDDLNKWAENAMPNYYTNVEKDARWYSPSKLFTANFFWDGIIKNMGFALGAASSGSVFTKGLSSLPLTARLFSVGKAAEALAATEEGLLAANKVADTYGKIKGLSDKFLSSYNLLNPGGRFLVAGLSTTGEAGFEAFHNLNDFRDQKIEEYKQINGVAPRGADLDRINKMAENVGNSSYLLNVGLLTATNYIQFPKLLGSSTRAESHAAVHNIVKDGEKYVREEAKTRIGRALSSAGVVTPYLFSTTEAFEEGAQFAVSVGTKDYYNKKYDGDVADFVGSLSTAIRQTYSTDEGMENILIGGLSGAIMLGRGKYQERAAKNKNTAEAIQAFNDYKISDFTKETIDAINRGTVLQQEREDSLRRGDTLVSKEKEADYLINYLTPRIKYGRLDLIKADLADFKNLAATEEGFAQLQAEGKVLSEDTRAGYLKRLANIERIAENMSSLYQSLQLRYGGLRTKDNKPVYSNDVINQMIYAATKIADYDNRIPEIANELTTKGIYGHTIAQETVEGKDEAFKENAAKIQALPITSDEKESLLEKLVDVRELSKRRKQFLEEYEDIKNSPKKYESVEIPEESAKVVLKTKTGDKEIELGTEYFLGRVVEHDKSGKEVYRSPKIIIIGENPDGTIKIKDAKGNVKDISKEVLEDYKLAKVSDTLSNKKAKFFMEHWNTIYEFNFGKSKKQRGRLEYSPKEGILNFVYKDKSGKIRSIEVTADQFVPKEGFNTAMISPVGELNVVQKKSLEDFAKEKDDRLAEKRKGRLEILNNLFDELSEQHNKTNKLISQKQSELKNINEELTDLQEQLKNAEFDERSKKALRFRTASKKALEAAIRLSRMKEQLENEIQALETEKETLEVNLEYITDLTQNIDELPTNTKDFLEELESQKALLENAILDNGTKINLISKLIDETSNAIELAVDYLNSLIKDFSTKYPKAPLALGQEWIDFLKENPNFLKLKPQYKEDLKLLEDMIAEVEDLTIKPDEEKIKELKKQLESVQVALKEVEKELGGKSIILDKFEKIAQEYRKQKAEEEKLEKDTNLRKELLGSADPGLQTLSFEKGYEPQSKKTDLEVVTSTKATSTDLPHHKRANLFGANLDKFPNREKIKGRIVTLKNEASFGLDGLMTFLKGNSDVDMSKTVALIMVNEKGVPIGVDGKPLGKPTFDNIIVQVFPDPSLTWSKEFGGGSMFRKETSKEAQEFYKKEYQEWINEQLESPDNESYDITASFGRPEYVSNLDEKGNKVRDYTAKVSVTEAGLIKSSDLKESPVIFIPTTNNTVSKGSVSFQSPLGRPFLNLPNGYVKLNNRKLTKNEALAVYQAIYHLALDVFENNNAKSDKSKRLINWLKSIVYWGIPKNTAGHNSIWFSNQSDGTFVLNISGKESAYVFTPSNIKIFKDEIIALLEGMYNNINSGMVNKDDKWNVPYEEIVNISDNGEIETKEWDNYQTYLLSKSDLPLSVQLTPIKEGETNRQGIYFTLKVTPDRYLKAPVKEATKPTEEFVLDGKTVNTLTLKSGKKINFTATSENDVKAAPGADIKEVYKDLKEKYGEKKAKEGLENAVKAAIRKQVPTKKETEEEEKTTSAFKKLGKNKPRPAKEAEQKPAKVALKKAEQELMEINIDDIDENEEIAFRKKLENPIFEKENWKNIEQWLSKNFPNIPVYRVRNILRTTNGMQAWGMLKNASIYVYENAEVGTIYHEVFEGVWKHFTGPQERADIENEFLSRKGEFVDRPTGKTVKYSDATPEQIKEQLAEEFRDYVLKQEKRDKKSIISKLFDDIIEFIKTFFKGVNAEFNTRNLFKKIGTGYYAQYTPTSPFSYVNKGIIDIESEVASPDAEYRVANIPANVVNEMMQHMTYITLKDLIGNNKSLFNLQSVNKEDLYDKLGEDIINRIQKSKKIAKKEFEDGKITKDDALAEIEKTNELLETVYKEWENIKKKHEEYLKGYSIEFDENDEVTLKDEDSSNKGFNQDATKIDTFRKANTAIKLLLSTIPVVDNKGKLVYSSINGIKVLPYSQVAIAIMNKVHSSRNIDEMVDRIKVMMEENINYATLYARLTKGTSDLSQFTETHDTQLLTAFWRTFKKQNPDVKNVYIFDNGDVEVGDSNLATAARQIGADYINSIISIVKRDNPYFEYSAKERAYIGKPLGVKRVKLATLPEKISFLKSLGIDFKQEEIAKLSNDKRDAFDKAVSGLKLSIEKADKIVTVSRKVLNIRGVLSQLATVRAIIDNPEFDSTYFNVNGERVQTFIGTSPVSDLYDYLSQIDNKEELLNTPYEYLLTDPFAQNSAIMNKMFNPDTGNRIKGEENLMRPGYADGTVNLEKGKKKQSNTLTYKERITQEINLNIKGYYYTLVPGDASMEHMVYMSNHITPETLLSGMGRVHTIFKGYFLSEYNLSKESDRLVVKDKNKKDLRFFKDILGDKLHEDISKEKGSAEDVYKEYESRINRAIDAFITKESTETFEILKKYDILKQQEDSTWSVDSINFTESDTMSEEVLKRELNSISINYIINNIELHKLLFSDPYLYSQELKRVKNALSPRQAIINSSPAFNKSLNTTWNEGYSEGDIGYTPFIRDYFRSATAQDVSASASFKDYGNFDETDGGGMISMKAYRWLRIKAGDWNDQEERQYRYDIAYEKKVKKQELSSDEEKLLENNPSVASAYVPLKPVVYGNKGGQTYNNVVLDKFALYPLSYRIMNETNPTSNALKLYNKMQKEDIDYVIFKSGRKVGAEQTHSLYNEDGTFNTLLFSDLINIPHNIISIQSEVPSKEDFSISRGSQITKLATLDYMEAGVPVDFNKDQDFQKRFDAWNVLTEEQRKEASLLYKEIKHNQLLLEEMTENAYSSLLKRLGIEENKEGFVMNDFSKVASTLREDILKREVNDNISEALNAFEKGKVLLEATPAYQQVRNILYSIADKNVISPKIKGSLRVQIPSTLLESIRAKKENGAYTSDVLKFYEDEDGKRVCEIMMSRWFNSPLSDKELLDYLNKTEEGQKILSGIAYRIPTQKQNSIDSFKIKQFLPVEFKDAVIIPSALVKKVGSDFDIDKLFIYSKNIYKDEKGRVKLLPFYGFGQEAKDKFKDLFLDVRELKIQLKEKQLEKQADFAHKFGDISLGIADEKTVKRWLPIFADWFSREIDENNGKFPVRTIEQFFINKAEKLNKSLDKLTDDDLQEMLADDAAEKWYKESLENEYIQSLQNLVSNPSNFEHLIKPNSADQLKNLSTEIVDAIGDEKFDYSSKKLLSRKFMSSLRQAFVGGKHAIGIAAVNQTNHSLNQRQPIYIDYSKWNQLPNEDKLWLSGGTMNVKDAGITFKQYNSIKINGKKVPTFSMIKDANGKTNISDVIGQVIDGYVDISNGPWIMELGMHPNVTPTWLFLIKLGVPVKDVAYFMNQPIVRDYLRKIDNAGYSWLFIDSYVEELTTQYSTTTALQPESEIPSAYELKKMLGKSVKELSSKQRNQQNFILGEFLKYARMANQMFYITQGTNWDTANFNDPYLVFKKLEQFKKAQNTLISSPEELMKNSFVKKLAYTINDLRNAFSTVLVSDRSKVRTVLENTLRPYTDVNDRDFVKIAQKAVNDLFDWAVQTNGGFNKQIVESLISDQNTAKQINDFVVSVKNDPNHPLHNNQLMKIITPHFSEKRKGGVNNVKIKNKANKIYDQNQLIYAFIELKNYLQGLQSPLYSQLMTLSILQSGLSNSPISFTSLLPYEDFEKIYSKTLTKLENIPNLSDFNALNVFQRNNWSNDELVPRRKATWKQNKNGEWKYNGNMRFYGYNNVENAIDKGEIPRLVKINEKSRESKADIIVYSWEEGTKKEKAEKKAKGDYSYIKRGLFKKIYRGNIPLTISFTTGDKVITDYVYQAINAWGDSHSTEGIYFGANEFYSSPRPSVIDNGFIKVENEQANSSIVDYFDNKVKPKIEKESSDSSNTDIPNC